MNAWTALQMTQVRGSPVNLTIEWENLGSSIFVSAIGAPGIPGKNPLWCHPERLLKCWTILLNDEPSSLSFDKLMLQPGDVVGWVFLDLSSLE